MLQLATEKENLLRMTGLLGQKWQGLEKLPKLEHSLIREQLSENYKNQQENNFFNIHWNLRQDDAETITNTNME